MPKSQLKSERNAEIVRLWRDGECRSVSALAERFGVSRPRVHQILRAAGLGPPPKKVLTPEQRKERERFYDRQRKARRRAQLRETSAVRKQADVQEFEHIDPELVRSLRAAIPKEDRRDRTGQLLGDPLPGDQRRARLQEQERRKAVLLPRLRCLGEP